MKSIYKLFILILVVFTLIVQSCKKSDPPKTNTSTAGQFLNQKTGSTWKYTTNNADSLNKVLVLDSSKLAYGKNYTVFYSLFSGSTTRNFYTYKQGNYYSLVASTANTYEEIIYLKDSTEIGKKWKKSINIGGTSYLYEYAIVANNIDITVNGLNFTNVVMVKLTIESTGYSAFSYYAPSVGLIKTDEVIASVPYTTEIKSYTLK